jgi:hypothetical protein
VWLPIDTNEGKYLVVTVATEDTVPIDAGSGSNDDTVPDTPGGLWLVRRGENLLETQHAYPKV